MKQIKVNIQGNTMFQVADWEEGVNVAEKIAKAINDGLFSDESILSVRFTTPICPTKNKKYIESNTDIKIVVDNTYFQVDDVEIIKVLKANNVGSGELIKQSEISVVTSIGDNWKGYWFSKNKNIKTFNSLPELTGLKSIGVSGWTNVSSAGFYECTNLEEIDLANITGTIGVCTFYKCVSLKELGDISNITDIQGSAFFGCSSLIKPLCFTRVKNTGGGHNYGYGIFKDTKIPAVFLPSLKVLGCEYTMFNNSKIVCDIGKSFQKVENLLAWDGNFGTLGFCIIRTLTLPSHVAHETHQKVIKLNGKKYVAPSLVSAYQSDPYWSSTSGSIYAIGGTEWQSEMRTLAETYAKEYAGWSDEQIANADYSDPYIDYDIFGVERPEE